MTDDSGETDIDLEGLARWLGDDDAPPSPKEQRRSARATRCAETFGSQSPAALDLLAIVDLAWHDCYGDGELPSQVVDDLFVTSGGDLETMVHMASLALTDWRDLRMNADRARSE
ncbi:hypothetical protein K9U39_20625 [Rhodoblastus acidophilus]|nr:hypothetical protein [Rhodoblastus acidophilus]